MSNQSPLQPDEVFFTYRLLFETLQFSEPIKKTAEPKFRELGLDNGAIENFIRAMRIWDYEMLPRVEQGHEPATVGFCPWENQRAFLKRDEELRRWINQNGSEPADIKTFIRNGVPE
jgi:hypothetical protein